MYRLHSLVHLFQQLVTERTNQVLATQPCTVDSMTGYRVYRPGTGYPALYILPGPTGYRVIRPSPFNSVDSVAGRQLLSTRYGFKRPVTEPSCLLPTSTKNQQPTGLSTGWPLLISSLFTGLRLMTGLIMSSP